MNPYREQNVYATGAGSWEVYDILKYSKVLYQYRPDKVVFGDFFAICISYPIYRNAYRVYNGFIGAI